MKISIALVALFSCLVAIDAADFTLGTVTDCQTNLVEEYCVFDSTDVSTLPDSCKTSVPAAIAAFKVCSDAIGSALNPKEICPCYETFYKALYVGSCITNGNVQMFVARSGFKFGVGMPTISSFQTQPCGGANDFYSTVGAITTYAGPGEIRSANADCVPSCASMCSEQQCSDAMRMNISYVLSLFVLAASLFLYL